MCACRPVRRNRYESGVRHAYWHGFRGERHGGGEYGYLRDTTQGGGFKPASPFGAVGYTLSLTVALGWRGRRRLGRSESGRLLSWRVRRLGSRRRDDCETSSRRRTVPLQSVFGGTSRPLAVERPDVRLCRRVGAVRCG